MLPTFASAIAPFFGTLGLLGTLWLFRAVLAYPRGGVELTKISDAIHSGSMVFLSRKYKTLTIFGLILFALLYHYLNINKSCHFICILFQIA